MRKIDIVAGGQMGDEGKGSVCAYLAWKKMTDGTPYGFAVRVGGSNAEHRFETPDGVQRTGRVLPVAGWIDPKISMVLGAGHMIKLDSFFKEVHELEGAFGCRQDRRIFIDAQAGVIDPSHVEEGKKAAALRGSTHQGNGRAVAHKVIRDNKFKLAKDYPELREYICDCTVGMMSGWMADGDTGLLEGSQGAFLSLNHGYYPFCTAKDVTPASMLSEAGIPTNRVRDTWAVHRTVYMRVPGNSGPCDGRELGWDELEALAGLKIPEEAKRQTDSGDRERVFMWSWKEFKKSCDLIGPSHLVLTFADWYPILAMAGFRLDDHIEEMERIARQPVVMVRNGSGWNDFYLRKE